MEKFKSKVNLIVLIISGLIILVIAFTNGKQFFSTLVSSISNSGAENLEDTLTKVEQSYRDNFYNKILYSEVYGITQKILGKKVIGNFEYVLDEEGRMNLVRESNYDVDKFVNYVAQIKSKADEKETPVLYVQAPNREYDGKYPTEYSFNVDNYTINELIKRLNENDIDVIDEREEITSSQDESFDMEDMFFHTDVHMKTDAEMWIAENMAYHLVNDYNINLSNTEYLNDMSYYNKSSYPFVGNFARNVGKYYTGVDQFDIYKPIFDTDFTYKDMTSDEVREGAFDKVLMNEFETRESDEYTYWIIDYLRYTKPYYTIYNNNNTDGDKILFVTDSMGYRTISYLALTASEITVLDPRFFNGVDYYEQAMENEKYDIVIVYQGTFLME